MHRHGPDALPCRSCHSHQAAECTDYDGMARTYEEFNAQSQALKQLISAGDAGMWIQQKQTFSLRSLEHPGQQMLRSWQPLVTSCRSIMMPPCSPGTSCNASGRDWGLGPVLTIGRPPQTEGSFCPSILTASAPSSYWIQATGCAGTASSLWTEIACTCPYNPAAAAACMYTWLAGKPAGYMLMATWHSSTTLPCAIDVSAVSLVSPSVSWCDWPWAVLKEKLSLSRFCRLGPEGAASRDMLEGRLAADEGR